MAMIQRLFPKQIDNTYSGQRLALWLSWFVVLFKIAQSASVIVAGHFTAISADAIPLDSYSPDAAGTILSLFTISAVARLLLCLICVVAMLRYRSAVPLMFLLLVIDYLTRTAVIYVLPIARSGPVGGVWVNLGLFVLTIVGLVLSLRSRTSSSR
jgi:hypothetical protein